jgi:serine/threonine protein phosphatase PrpC
MNEMETSEKIASNTVVLLPFDVLDCAFKNVVAALRSNRPLNSVEAATFETSFLEWNRSEADLKQNAASLAPDRLTALVMTKVGWRTARPYMNDLPKLTNEDRCFVMKYTQEYNNESIPVLVSGVLDGHGAEGEAVAEWSRREFLRRLPRVLHEVEQKSKVASKMTSYDLREPITDALSKLIVSIDRDLPEAISTNGGTTISFVLHYRKVLYLVNTGDSQSFLAFASENPANEQDRKWVGDDQYVLRSYVGLSTDLHTPHSERARLEAAGMRVTSSNRVICDTTAERYSLSMSRSIGDRDAVGVIATPHIKSFSEPFLVDLEVSRCNAELQSAITNENVRLFVVSATDGILNHVDKEIIWSGLQRALLGKKKHVVLAAEAIFDDATRCSYEKSNNVYCDDMAIAIAQIL